MTKQNILLSGSAGFIGQNFTRLYQDHPDYELFHVDELQQVSDRHFWRSLPSENKYAGNVSLIEKYVLDDWKIDYVIHMAARSHVDASISDPMSFTMDNIVATHKLLEACRKYGKLKKFVLVSTDEVLGSLSIGDPPFREDDPIEPNSPYSASKASQELLARAYAETYDLPIVITRCSNNFGPFQDTSKLIPKAMKCLLKGENIPVYGDGKNVRDWIWVNDHCRGIMAALENGLVGETYHFGGDNELTNLEILKMLIILCPINKDFDKALGWMKSIEFVGDRAGHDRRYAMNSYKAKKELGWFHDNDSMAQMITELWEWAMENRSWFED